MSSAATEYPGNPNSRTFDAGNTGGWTPQSSYGGVLGGLGVCDVLGGLSLCPTIEGSHVASGGNPNGYLNTNAAGSVALLATAASIWTSPQFQYNGDQGSQPNLLHFSMDGLADIGGLLAALPGGLNDVVNNVTLTADIVNANDPDDVVQVLVPEAPLTQILGFSTDELTALVGETAEPTWHTATSEVLTPSTLTMGDWYQVRVTTEYSGLGGLGLGVLPEINIGFDNVALSALTSGTPGGPGTPGTPGGPGTPGAPGGDGGAGGKGADGGKGRDGKAGAVLNGKNLLRTVKKQMPRRVRIARNGRWIRVPVRCPKKFNKRCKVQTVAKFKRRGKAITRVKTRAVGKGVKRNKALFVKRPFRAKVKKAKRVFIQQTVKVGKVKVRVIKPVRLVKR